MKKSVKARIICLIVAAMVLTSAVVAAAVTGSPYEILKNALMDAVTSRNITEERHITLSVDGVIYDEVRTYNVNGDDSALSYVFDTDGNVRGYRYSSKNMALYPEGVTAASGEQWYSANVFPESVNNDLYYPGGSSTLLFSPGDRNSAQMRFLELIADALIGDLKNNITMTSENGMRYIQGTLTESQVPELVKAGIDVLVEQSTDNYVLEPDTFVGEYNAPIDRADYDFNGNPLNLPMQSLVINYVHGEAEVDMNGDIQYMDFNVTFTMTSIFGDAYKADIKANVRFSDIGTSDPACPIAGAEQLLTPEYMKGRYGNTNMRVFFKLQEDGSIDADSVTTTYPTRMMQAD